MTAPDERTLRRWLEFHDSELVSLMHTADAAMLELDAYVHRWDYLEGGWRGSGWTQRVRITVFDPSVHIREPEAPDYDDDCRDIWQGKLHCGSTAHQQLVPLPFAFAGSVRLDIDMNTGRAIRITGHGVRLEPLGDPTFVEELSPELAPDDHGNGGTWH